MGEQILKTLQDYERAGELLAQSRICGSINPPAGAIILMMCAESGTPLEKFIQRYHVIPTMQKTEISKKAETMVVDFLEAGGQMDILVRTPAKCEARFQLGKSVYVSSVAWDEISQESYTKGRDGKLKENWSTPRRRMQMMWARCISDGIRAICPSATSGQYTAEEVQDFDERQAVPSVRDEADEDPMPIPVRIDDDPTDEEESVVVPPPALPKAPAEAPPMPFAMNGPADLDYTVCRAEGPYQNVKWALVPEEKLKIALAVTCPNIYDQDRDEIRRILASKETNNKKGESENE